MATVYRNRQLVYLLIIFFFYFCSIGCLAPFLTAHMRHLGFSLPEVSFINAVAAFASLLGPLIGGPIAERHGLYKSVSIICIFVGAIAFSAISFVPKSERLHYKPLVDFSCRSGLRIERCINWDNCREGLPNSNSTTVHLTNCKYNCAGRGQVSTAHPLHICFHGEPGNICVVYDSENGNLSATEFETQLSLWPFDEKQDKPLNFSNQVNFGSHDVFDAPWTETESETESDALRAKVAMCNYHPAGTITLNQKVYNRITCRPNFGDCIISCQASFSVSGVPVFPNSCEEADGDPSVTFWSYIILRCIGDLCIFTTICLLDALIACNTSDFDGAYGRIHFWPALGLAAFAPFSGALLDHFTDMEGKSDFSPSMFVAAGLAVITCALIIALPIQHQKSSPQFKSLKSSTSSRKYFTFELFLFVIIVIVLGMQWGVMFTFLPWLTMDIGCSGMVTGLGYTLVFGCCLPFLHISSNLVRTIGRANLLVFAFLFYGTRYAGVSFVYSQWWTLPFAAMGSFTLCVMWVAVVSYGQSLAPAGSHIVMQYVLNVLHFGIGRGLGSLLGGTLISHHGQREMFRGVAVFSACLAFVYLAIYHFGIRRHKNRRKSGLPVTMNGSWHPLQDQQKNGKSNGRPKMIAEQEDDDSDVGN